MKNLSFFEKLFGSFSTKELKKIQPIADRVLALEARYQAMTDRELQAMTPALRERLAGGETLDDILPDAFAVCREASWRVLGMKHFPVQVVGGIVLHRACIAEMKTGEGKTCRHAARISERAHRQGRARRHRERLPGQTRQRVDGKAV